MLNLPHSTEVNRRIAKEKLYANAAMTTSAKEALKNQVEAVFWRHKLAESTIGVAAGESVQEIQVFELSLRQRSLDKSVLPAIARAIPYKILFILTFENSAQAWMEAEGTFYGTDWLPPDKLSLKFEGLNLDAMYDSLVRQIAGGRLDAKGNIAEAVERDKRRQKLEKEIAALEKRVFREKQFNRQVELNGKLRRLRRELAELNAGT